MTSASETSFATADLAHVRTMILMHHLMSAIISLRHGRSSWFEGNVREGRYGYSDEQECNFSVGWSAEAVVGLASHRHSAEPASESADPLRWLADEGAALPEGICELGRRVVGDEPADFTSGMYITRERRHRRGSKVGKDNGLDRIEAFTAHHRSAFQLWNGPIGITEAQGELAWVLAQRASAGGGELTETEMGTLLDPRGPLDELSVVTPTKIATVTEMLGAIQLRAPFAADLVERERVALERLRRGELEDLGLAELELFRAAAENDVEAVRRAIARGARSDARSVKRMLPELHIPPGWSPLAVAFQRKSLEAALALIEAGASIAEESGESALTRSVRANSLPLARACLARGATKPMLTQGLLLAVQQARALRDAGASSLLTELLDAGGVIDDRLISFARYCGDVDTIAHLEARASSTS